jgi:hypothetical protein
MKMKLEEYRKESDRAIKDNKQKIASMSAGFERELAQGKAAHKAELAQLETKLQGDIQHLQQDLDFCADSITGLETLLDESLSSNKKLSGEIVGLNTERHSTEALLKQSSHDLDVTKKEVGRLQEQIQAAQQSGAVNTAQIQKLQQELTEKSALLTRLQNGAIQFASEKERLLGDLSTLRQWKESTQDAIDALSDEVALDVLSKDIILQEGGTRIDNVIAKLSGIRDELYRKDVQLGHAKSATEALLRKEGDNQREQELQQRSGEEERLADKRIETRLSLPYVGGVVIGDGGFSDRHKNVASVRKNN